MLMQCNSSEIRRTSVTGPVSLYGIVTSVCHYLDLALVDNCLLSIQEQSSGAFTHFTDGTAIEHWRLIPAMVRCRLHGDPVANKLDDAFAMHGRVY